MHGLLSGVPLLYSLLLRQEAFKILLVVVMHIVALAVANIAACWRKALNFRQAAKLGLHVQHLLEVWLRVGA